MVNQQYRLVIDGQSIATEGTFDVLNPSDGQVVGAAPKATVAQLDQAVSAAQTAYEKWSKADDATRQKACVAIADTLRDHAEELAQLLTLEQGKPLNGMGSRYELGGVEAWARYTAGLELPVKVLQDDNQGRVELHRKPVGVVGSITPWNWPLMIAIWHIVPAIRTGNTVVIKPSPLTPLSTIRMIELLNTVLPAGVLNCVTGENDIGAAMSSHPGIAKIVFTGSTETGKKIMAGAAATLKRLTLELGGNDAGIVLPDCDPRQIAEGLFWGAFINGGQTCAALKRLYVHEDIYEDVCRELTSFAATVKVGDGLSEDSVLGPVQNRMQYQKVKDLVEDAKRRGGRILIGGDSDDNAPGNFYPVTLVADLNNGDRLVDEEQFGPALPIIKYSDLDEVIRRANDNPNGLGGSVWGRDLAKAKKVASQLECGSVWINKHGAIQPNVPFGGVKGSGLGVEFAEEGLVEYTTIQVIFQ
ncbi:Phenylacetaldehyde dehydrogenase(PAD) (plasmid) [Neorhizobium galegae bv. officinalis bv. officinalis str. HAMBI 1141]|uniref:Phenylacetaldehyde dehydrogenase(PAD) n=1 Tax=Neorhizobium galegae bv. officinalis bv. officinalis str. HAMBI 1141 TaxID=1028801 RepID=A0A068TGL2_NEOGA|nr:MULTISPECIES: aldehyde dehydrogenase family protein [Neorhizobium]MCJ9670761.1 aldehyde dehydrogenase family protein [Neorhizobium sp. SHOUNA12B]MCJ9745834.1 aldehyde dehydrogenase family protein [Neorhizobium sp. SHOUNA12A]CDN57587.1 Phenylacetaldehyde dehydrogenase(PAD) [Neorhizobium galegae bv. officinalis bv. officinalis str. HAMBI 1141]